MKRMGVLLMIALAACLACRLVESAQPAARITPLQAIHVAELHTGAAATDVELASENNEPAYHVRIVRGEERLRVGVQAIHGRLLSLARADENGEWIPTYRWPGIRVVAHRGGVMLGPPENTLPAIRKAIETGADLIEIDVRQTKDGHLVLMHDPRVDRTTSGQGAVESLTLEEIRKLRIKAEGSEAIGVPTLREALDIMRGLIDADLDFKEGDLNLLVSAVRETGMAENSTFCGPDERCRQLAALEPRIRLRPTVDFPEKVPAVVRDLRPAIINLDWHAVTEDAIRAAHLGGCHAFVNCLETADTDLYARLAASAGADYIQTDRPDRVIKMLETLELRSERPSLGDPLGTPLRHPRLRYPLR